MTAAAAAAGLALLAACGTAGSPSGGQSASTPSSVRPSAPATAASAPPSASPASHAAAASCTTSTLKIVVDVKQGGAAAGSAYYPIDFTNTGTAACTLFGYPGVSFVTGKGGSEIGSAASRGGGAAAQVTLPPGAAAHSQLQVVDAGNYSASACRPATAHWLRVYPPGQTMAGYAAFTAEVCSAALPTKLGSALSIYPVRAGQGKMGQAP